MDADKSVALDSDKPSDVLSTSLCISSQQSSFSSVIYGNEFSDISSNRERSFREKMELFESSTTSQNQDSIPIKVSPVSERIKALEALAAKRNDSDWTDGGFSHCRERYYEKSPTELHGISYRSSIKKKSPSTEHDSPESPFEILGESRRGSDLEDSADWMRAHLPPAPNFNLGVADFDEKEEVKEESPPEETKSKDLCSANISESFVGVPDEFMDTTAEDAYQINDANQFRKESVDDESAFDLRFLPTAYIYNEQEKSLTQTQDLPCPPETQVSDVMSPAALGEAPSLVSSAPVSQTVSKTMQESRTLGVGEPAEVLEVDSSGESDDTVIEDSSGDDHAAGKDAPACTTSNTETLPQWLEKQIIQVPIINVINEPEEQVLSDYEVEHDDEVDDDDEICHMHGSTSEVSQPSKYNFEVSKSVHKEISKTVGNSCATMLVDSDTDCSSGNKIINDEAEEVAINQTCLDSNSLSLEISQAQSSNANSISVKSSINDVKSDKIEVVNDLSANPNDLLSEIGSSDIDPCLDNYSSEDQALKDQLHSGIYGSIAETIELMKTNPVQDSWESSRFDQHSYEKVVNNEFNETCLESQSECNSFPGPQPSTSGIAITEEIQMEPLGRQNKSPSLEELCLKQNTKTNISSADSSVTKDVHLEPVDSQDKIPSLDREEPFLNEKETLLVTFSITDDAQVKPLVSQNDKTSLQFENKYIAQKPELSSASIFVTEDVHIGPLGPQNNIPSDEFEEQCPDQNTICTFESLSLVEGSYVTQSAVENNAPANFLSFHNDATDKISEVMSDFVGRDLTKILVTNAEQDERDQCNDPEIQKILPEITEPFDGTDQESSTVSATDSFVEFMKECLKSQQDENSKGFDQGHISHQPIPVTSSSSSTISALNELGSCREKDIPICSKAKPLSEHEHSTGTIHTAQPLLSESQPDASLTEEVEAIDILVAEAYHLAEHVLTLLLTHLSGKILFFLGSRPPNLALTTLALLPYRVDIS